MTSQALERHQRENPEFLNKTTSSFELDKKDNQSNFNSSNRTKNFFRPSVQDRVKELEKKANELFEKKDYDKALEKYQKLIGFQIRHLLANYRCGKISEQKRKFLDLYKYFGKVVEIQESYDEYNCCLRLAEICDKELNKTLESIKYYKIVFDYDQDNENVCFSLGKCYLKDQQDVNALKMFQKTVEINSENKEAHKLIVQQLQKITTKFYNEGNFEKAFKYYKELSQIDETNLLANYRCALICAQKQNQEDAYNYFEKVVAKDENFLDICQEIAKTCYHLGKIDESVDFYEKAKVLNQDKVNSCLSLGLCFQKEQQVQSNLLGQYQKILDLLQNYAQALNKQGMSYKELGNEQDAIECFYKAKEFDPSDLDSYFNLYECSIDQNEMISVLKEQVEVYEKTKKTDTYPQICVRIGQELATLENIEIESCFNYFMKAKKYFYDRNQQQHEKDCVKLIINLAESLDEKGYSQEAIYLHEQLKQMNVYFNQKQGKDYYKILYNQGVQMKKSKNYEDATEKFKKILIKNPNDVKTIYKLGCTQYKQQQNELAKATLEKVTKKDQNFAKAYNKLGVIYQEEKLEEAAIQQYLQAVQYKINKAKTYYNLGILFENKNEHKKTDYYFKIAGQLDPKYRKANQDTIPKLEDFMNQKGPGTQIDQPSTNEDEQNPKNPGNSGNPKSPKNPISPEIPQKPESPKNHQKIDYDKVDISIPEKIEEKEPHKKTIEELEKEIRENPNNEDAHIELGELFEENNAEKALNQYQGIMQNNIRARWKFAILKGKQGEDNSVNVEDMENIQNDLNDETKVKKLKLDDIKINTMKNMVKKYIQFQKNSNGNCSNQNFLVKNLEKNLNQEVFKSLENQSQNTENCMSPEQIEETEQKILNCREKIEILQKNYNLVYQFLVGAQAHLEEYRTAAKVTQANIFKLDTSNPGDYVATVVKFLPFVGSTLSSIASGVGQFIKTQTIKANMNNFYKFESYEPKYQIIVLDSLTNVIFDQKEEIQKIQPEKFLEKWYTQYAELANKVKKQALELFCNVKTADITPLQQLGQILSQDVTSLLASGEYLNLHPERKAVKIPQETKINYVKEKIQSCIKKYKEGSVEESMHDSQKLQMLIDKYKNVYEIYQQALNKLLEYRSLAKKTCSEDFKIRTDNYMDFVQTAVYYLPYFGSELPSILQTESVEYLQEQIQEKTLNYLKFEENDEEFRNVVEKSLLHIIFDKKDRIKKIKLDQYLKKNWYQLIYQYMDPNNKNKEQSENNKKKLFELQKQFGEKLSQDLAQSLSQPVQLNSEQNKSDKKIENFEETITNVLDGYEQEVFELDHSIPLDSMKGGCACTIF